MNKDTNTNTRVGQKVRALRKARKWTLKDLSRRAGFSYQYLAGLERGERRWSISRLTQVALHLGVTPGMILDMATSSTEGVTK